MMRKIYLEGELGRQFGKVHSFNGESVQDAFRLIASNKPEFRKYLIDAVESDIGFSIQVENTHIEDVRECLLPLRNGDIIITPVPMGSKSGGGKILTAIAIGLLLFMPGGALLLHGAAGSTIFSMAAAGGWAGATASVLTGLAINLALTGIQQLMAPDPAVDQEDEGYLFNGSETNIVEGMPVPLLYGELRVPGYPVSFEIIQSGKTVTAEEQYIDDSGNIINNPYETTNNAYPEELAYLYGDNNTVFNFSAGSINTGRVSGTQDILFTDIISEGPIYGLVDGGNSVYLDDDPAQLDSQAATRLSDTPVEFVFTNGSANVTINKNGYTKNIEADLANGAAYLVVRNYKSSAGTASEATVAGSARAISITTSTGIFQAGYVYPRGASTTTVIVRLVSTTGSTIFEGYIDSYTSSTQVTCIPLQGADISPAFTTGSYTVVIDGKLQVISIASNQESLILAAAFPVASNTYKADLAGTSYGSLALEDRIALGSKYRSYSVQFRSGNLTQPAFADAAGTGVGSIALGQGVSFTPGAPTLYAEEYEASNPTVEYTGTSASAFGLSLAQAEEVDEIRVTFAYPQLWNRSETGSQKRATVRYNAFISISKDGSTFSSYQALQSSWEHVDRKNAPSIWEEVVDLRPYQPFKDFKLKITRTTYNDRAYNEGTNTFNTSYTTSSDVQISSLNSIIKENLSYPLTAMAKVRVNSKEFSRVPSRTYHCKGLKVLVPSNYVTRDEGANGVASYNRNITTGAITTSYQDWDGEFRPEKVYTNNPAWVFYDILTNTRYGLGTWLEATDIDKYALYRIARYCDELVPNGNGGYEPRFTTNVYLTQATDAYKVLKDLATIFRGMLYWVDGQIFTTIDQPSDPVYNFSKGNIIEGAFNYESTGSKTRANQVVVSWNNPAANYKLENLIVEDPQNIVNTSKIITEEAVAFGATTEGQALRYGRWKLWTAVNQTEIVSFKTALNAAFLAPGDIINVQDSDRYPGNLKYSGRISNTGTRNTTTIPLDRPITLSSGSTYELSVLTSGDVATLAQDSAVISSVTYYRGDILPDTDNIVDDSGNYVDITYKPYTNIETRAVSTSAGSNVTSLAVSSAFSETPAADTIWALREAIGGIEVLGSKKLYKILSISEESRNEYAITAVEFYNEKYTAVDENFTLSTQDPIYRPPISGDIIPAPRNVYVYVSDLNSGQVENDAVLYWDAPVTSEGADYQYVDYYELDLSLPGLPPMVRVGKNQRSASGFDLPVGTHTVGVRTVAVNGQKSAIVKATFNIEDPARQAVPRKFGIALGAVSSSPAFITSTGNFTFENKDFTISPVGDPTVIVSFDGSPEAEYIQDCSGMSNVDYLALPTQEDKLLAAHFIMLDSNDSDPLKLIKYYKDPALGYGYFYNTGAGSTSPSSNWTNIGTVSVSVNSNKVIGTGTSFLSSVRAGDLIKFSSTQAAKVVYIASNTDIRIDKSFTTAISSVSASRNSFRFDKDEDAIIAQIRRIADVYYYYPVNLAINPDLGKDSRSVILSVAPTFFNFDGLGNLTTTYSNIVLTATSFGYKNPEFKITGAGFDNTEISQVAETSFSVPTSDFTYVKTLDKVDEFSTTDLIFTVTVRDALDPDNVAKQSTTTVTIPFIKDGENGDDGTPGLRYAEGYLYYQSAGIPATTPSGILTWATGVVSGTNIGIGSTQWWTSPPQMGAGSNASFYVRRWTSSQSVYTDATSALNIGAASLGINFAGVVTFSGGTLSDGTSTFDPSTKISTGGAATDINTSITTINGGKITTGSISLDLLQSNTLTSAYQDSDSKFAIAKTAVDIIGTSAKAVGYFVCGASADIALAGDAGTASSYGVAGRGNVAGGIFVNSDAGSSFQARCATDLYAFLSSTFGVKWNGDIYTNSTTSSTNTSTGALIVSGGVGVGGNINLGGSLTATGNVTAYSDARLKENLKIISNAIEKVQQLTGYTFDRTDLGVAQTGLLAQDVQKVMPEAVTEGEYLGVNYGSLVGLLVEAIKELKVEVQELKNGLTK